MSSIRIEYSNRVASITLNRPEKRNALNPALISELLAAFSEASAYPDCKVIILKAEGEVFCAGADLEYLEQLKNNSYEEQTADSSKLKELYQHIYSVDQVVIAQVEGHAIAGGCGLLTVCDLVIAVPEAKFGYTEVKIGFVPAIVAPFLTLRIGQSRCRELLLSGDLVSAQTAERYGLVNYLAAPGSIVSEVTALAERLVEQNSGRSIATTKRLLREIEDLSLEQAAALGAETNAKSRMTDDFKKGIASFLQKTKPSW
jgi:methylglutaconyl-CoA hydratase